MGIFEGQLRVEKGDRFALIAARFNEFIVDRLIGGATDCILRHGGSEAQIDLIRVPGAFELPQVAKKVALSGNYAGVVVLGAVIRGGTPHFDMIANEVTKGTAQVGLEAGIPVIFGVLTTDSVEQAIDRAGTKMGNKGWEAAMTLLESVDLFRALPAPRKGTK
ncbi:6,7-dimethyl-8-ribityllumazine synthase [Mesoterricola silvestris]|uniref:6,7-dimethyl-8-ribityllumazine synthase n=1 Tax=Mesoterricola silvestris TaxID=2927979 RepID=A0AA48K7X7_9BACT|nr:6,7-dimethyl-8-ribityllumazine synthase [Mesoterricola silvestris]BDU71631.1 6,7-dimethyl-8-ribityllumazine synthase [Mesoterricola silvestris]